MYPSTGCWEAPRVWNMGGMEAILQYAATLGQISYLQVDSQQYATPNLYVASVLGAKICRQR